MRQIEITFDTDGSVRTETKGYSGISCLQADRFIAEALGRVTATRPTPEAFEAQQEHQHVTQ